MTEHYYHVVCSCGEEFDSMNLWSKHYDETKEADG